MKLQDLLYRVKTLKLIGLTSIKITNIHFDSRKVKKNGMFIAIKGIRTDGHNYIEKAIRKGAKVILVENIPVEINDNITYVKVVNSNKALSVIASNFYHNPSKRIKLIGVTGTNGKTTIVSLLHQIFGLLNNKAGMLSTIENKIVENVIESTHTTPDILQINLLLNQMIDKGCKYCFMEVSSHAIHQGRVNGLYFSGGVFTNITRDHLDYHHTFSNYLNVKKSFLDSLSKQAFALVNKDDKYALKMLEGTKAKKITYSLKSLSDYKCKVLENQFQGMLLPFHQQVRHPHGKVNP